MKKRKTSILNCPLQIPSSKIIDKKLVIGSVLFGLGWGLGGICPGPAILLTGMGLTQGILFTLAMIAGMAIFQLFQRTEK